MNGQALFVTNIARIGQCKFKVLTIPMQKTGRVWWHFEG